MRVRASLSFDVEIPSKADRGAVERAFRSMLEAVAAHHPCEVAAEYTPYDGVGEAIKSGSVVSSTAEARVLMSKKKGE